MITRVAVVFTNWQVASIVIVPPTVLFCSTAPGPSTTSPAIWAASTVKGAFKVNDDSSSPLPSDTSELSTRSAQLPAQPVTTPLLPAW